MATKNNTGCVLDFRDFGSAATTVGNSRLLLKDCTLYATALGFNQGGDSGMIRTANLNETNFWTWSNNIFFAEPVPLGANSNFYMWEDVGNAGGRVSNITPSVSNQLTVTSTVLVINATDVPLLGSQQLFNPSTYNRS